MPYKNSDLKKGKNRYTVIDIEGDHKQLSADTEEEAKEKAENILDMKVFKVTEILKWSPGGTRQVRG